MTLILPSTVVLFLYETFQVFISKGIPSRRDEQPFNLIRRIFREGGLFASFPGSFAQNWNWNTQGIFGVYPETRHPCDIFRIGL